MVEEAGGESKAFADTVGVAGIDTCDSRDSGSSFRMRMG